MSTKLDELKERIVENGKKAYDAGTKHAIDAINWGLDNPEKVVAGVTLIVGAVKASQSLIVTHRVKMERRRIDHTYYDPSTGMHWDLLRRASNADRAEILRRKALGESVPKILMDLKLIRL